MFAFSIKHKIYTAFGLLVGAVVLSAIFNDYLIEQFTNKAEYNTQTIETFSLTMNSITGDLYDAQIHFNTFQQSPTAKEAKLITEQLLAVQGSIQFLSNFQAEQVTGEAKTEQPFFNNHLEEMLELVYRLQGELSKVEDELIESEKQRRHWNRQLLAELQILSDEISKKDLPSEQSMVQALISIKKLAADNIDQAQTLSQESTNILKTLLSNPSIKQHNHSNLLRLSEQSQTIFKKIWTLKNTKLENTSKQLNETIQRTKQLNDELISYNTTTLESFQDMRASLHWKIYSILFISLSGSILLSWMTVRKIIISLNKLKASIINISQEKFDQDIDMQGKKDEVGEIASAIHQLKQQSMDKVKLEKNNISILKRLENIFNHAPIGLIEIDSNGKIILANKEICKLLKYDESELINQDLSMLIDLKIRKSHELNVRNFITSGENRPMNNGRQFTIHNKLGEALKVQISLSKINDKDEKFAIASILDLTELNAMQVSFNEQKNLLTAMIKDAPECILVTDPDRNIQIINPAFSRIFGHQKEDIIGKNTKFLYANENDYIHVGEERYNQNSKDTTVPFQINYRKKDGELFPSETIGGPITNKDGEIIGFMAFIRDISERQQEQLRVAKYQSQVIEINNRLNIATRSAKIGIWEYEIATNELHWNDEMFELFGQAKEDFSSSLDDFNKCVHPDDLEYINSKMFLSIDKKKDFTEDFRILNPQKGILFIHVHATIALDKEGNVERIIGLNWDRTQDITAQLKIKQSHQLLSAISQAQQDYIADKSTKHIYKKLLIEVLSISSSNTGFIVEFKDENYTHNSIKVLTSLTKNKATPNFNEKVILQILTQHKNEIISNKNNPSFYLETNQFSDTNTTHKKLNCFPFFAGNKILGMICLIQGQIEHSNEEFDLLSPIKSTLVQLIEATQLETIKYKQDNELKQLALVASKTNNAVIITDKYGKIEWVNDAFTVISGYEFPEVIGKKPGPLLQGKNTDKDSLKYLSKRIKKGLDVQLELINYHKSGREYWINIEIQAIKNDKNQITQFIAVETDITNRKHAEAQLHDAVARSESFALTAQQANKAKSEFLANMSHEIRTPMNGVLGMLTLLSKSKLNNSQEKQVQLAHDSAESLLVIINDILDFSKIEAGKLEIEHIDFNLIELLNKFCQGFAYRCNEKNINFHINIDHNVPKIVNGDPSRLRQVLINLCGNALKFTQQGFISLNAVKLNNDLIQFEVRDTGIGIAKDKMKGLFEKFNQLDGSTTRKYGGTGLGLSISSQLIDLMQGEIKVHSTQNMGTTFTFTVNLPEVTPQPNYCALNITNKNALVIEENQIDQDYLRKLLKEYGMNVDCTNNLTDANNLLNNNASGYDLIFINVDTNNETFVKSIKPLHDRQPNSALVLTSKIGLHNINAEIVDIDLSGKLEKPIFDFQLAETLTTIFTENAIMGENQNKDTSPTEIAKSNKLILLVEDNIINQEVAKGILEEFDCQIDIADNGQIALQMLKEKSYYGVIMDCQMPVMDGYETTRRIRNAESGNNNINIPIVAMTANTMSGDKEKCIEAGMNDFIAKPINIMTLHEKLKQWMGIDFIH